MRQYEFVVRQPVGVPFSDAEGITSIVEFLVWMMAESMVSNRLF
jgi:hypothetical protein